MGRYKTRISSTAKNRNWLIFLVRNTVPEGILQVYYGLKEVLSGVYKYIMD
jgi:hypothetical protein